MSNQEQAPSAPFLLDAAAKCIDDICSEHLGRVEAFEWLQSGTELYSGQTLWNACARAGEVEREKIKAALLAMHEAHKHRHNYYACAVVELFGS